MHNFPPRAARLARTPFATRACFGLAKHRSIARDPDGPPWGAATSSDKLAVWVCESDIEGWFTIGRRLWDRMVQRYRHFFWRGPKQPVVKRGNLATPIDALAL